jgi:hypothetical protein
MPDITRKIHPIHLRIDGKAPEDVKIELEKLIRIIVDDFQTIADIKMIDETKN